MVAEDRRTGQGAAQPVFGYAALIGDVVASRELEDRAGVQRRLRGLLSELNRQLREGGGEAAEPGGGKAAPGRPPLAVELGVTAGDEIQGLLLRAEAAVDVMVRLADELHPVRITWGIGIGDLETDLEGDVSLLDGPCFHRARSALERAARDGAWARLEGIDPVLDRGLSALFRLMGAVRDGWTETQARYARATRGRLQKEVAEEYGVSPSVVSESLKAARYRDVLEGEAAARELLSRFGPGAEEAPDSVPAPNGPSGVPGYLA